MSMRAYKIIEVKRKDTPAFNVGEEFDWIMDYANWGAYNDSGELTQVEFERDTIANAMGVLGRGSKTKRDLHCLEVLKNILADFKKGEEYVLYDCY